MKRKVQEQWVEALRSGEYTQGRGLLATVDGDHCALGVLCDLAVKEGVIHEPLEQPSGALTFDGWTVALPRAVRHWAHLDALESGAIANKNDDGASFEEIADYIEQHDNKESK